MLCGDGSCKFLLMTWRLNTGRADFTVTRMGCHAHPWLKTITLEVVFVRRLAMQDDREPDYESHPGIEVVPTTLIAAVTRSGRNTVRNEPTESEMDCDNEEILEPPPVFRHADMRPLEEPPDDGDSYSSSSDLEEDLEAEKDILADIAPVGGWCSPAMKELQSGDVEIARVRAWVERGTRPPAIDLEAEGQGVRSMVVL
jgi:hypothetical protein